jgi:hypothetical protein
MVGKRVQFDDEVWEAVVALAQRIGSPLGQTTSDQTPWTLIAAGSAMVRPS